MKQTLKISIVRGGCRFATPLYLGGEYALTFEGERADEAKTLLVTRPQKDRDGNLIALAKSETSGYGSVSLSLNRQALVDWFGTCGAEDVDATVDAHVYVFDANSVVIADSDVAIEYRPIDFVISDKEFEKWSEHEDRIEALEDASKAHDAAIADHENDMAALAKQDKKDLETSAADATAKADAALAEAKAYSDGILDTLAHMQYVRCDDESTEERKVYHRVSVVKNSLGQHVLAVDETQSSIEGGDPDSGKYVTLDTEQTVTADKNFTGTITATTQSRTDSTTKVATTKFVNTVVNYTADVFSTSLTRVDNDVNSLKKRMNDVETAATSAQSTANDAQAAASSAQSTANDAQTAASSAQSTAKDAKTAASSAQSTANDAKAAASSAAGRFGTTLATGLHLPIAKSTSELYMATYGHHWLFEALGKHDHYDLHIVACNSSTSDVYVHFWKNWNDAEKHGSAYFSPYTSSQTGYYIEHCVIQNVIDYDDPTNYNSNWQYRLKITGSGIYSSFTPQLILVGRDD